MLYLDPRLSLRSALRLAPYCKQGLSERCSSLSTRTCLEDAGAPSDRLRTAVWASRCHIRTCGYNAISDTEVRTFSISSCRSSSHSCNHLVQHDIPTTNLLYPFSPPPLFTGRGRTSTLDPFRRPSTLPKPQRHISPQYNASKSKVSLPYPIPYSPSSHIAG